MSNAILLKILDNFNTAVVNAAITTSGEAEFTKTYTSICNQTVEAIQDNLHNIEPRTTAPDTVPDTSTERTPDPAQASPNRQLKEESK